MRTLVQMLVAGLAMIALTGVLHVLYPPDNVGLLAPGYATGALIIFMTALVASSALRKGKR
jgi:hypothetical protein